MAMMPLRERERIMRHLLSLGATDKDVPNTDESTLVKAVAQGYEVGSSSFVFVSFFSVLRSS